MKHHHPAPDRRATPFYLHQEGDEPFVVIFYKNFMRPECGAHSHIGLGVNGLHTIKVLRELGIRAEIQGVRHAADIGVYLYAHADVSHVVIEAPWLTAVELADLANLHPHAHFVVRTHSNVAFLQADRSAMRLLREYSSLSEGSLNVSVAANSESFRDFMREAYRSPFMLLPNLYQFERVSRKRPVSHDHRLLRIGSFGARRVLKNHATAAAAAILIARRRGCDLEFHLSSNRDIHSGITETIHAMFADTQGMRLVEVPWKPWQDFRHVVGHMDLCLQPSHTESFNICTADGIAENVPSVVSEAIGWAPASWVANADDPNEIAQVGSRLLSDPFAPEEGLVCLERYVVKAAEHWLAFLRGPLARRHPHRG